MPPGERSYQFLTGWISRLLRIGGWTLSGEDPSEIRSRVEDLYAFPPSGAVGGIGSLAPVKDVARVGPLARRGSLGAVTSIIPADGDDLNLQDWQVIDMAGAAEHEDLCEAALFYLLERMRLALEDPAETPASSSWWWTRPGAICGIRRC